MKLDIATQRAPAKNLTPHLSLLESEAIHILRETAANFRNPVLLFSGGKAFITLVQLALKAFHPATVIKTQQLPINPLHARGYPSIGCACCTRAVTAGETARAGRWWWEQGGTRECGLHEVRTTSAKPAAIAVN